VYPAAGLVGLAPASCEMHVVDPQAATLRTTRHVTIWNEKASSGVPKLADRLVALAHGEGPYP
jgi:hypothetical protein